MARRHFFQLFFISSPETRKLPWFQIPEDIQNWKRKKTTSGNGLVNIRRGSSKSDSTPFKRRGLLTPRYKWYGEPPNQLPKISKMSDIFCTPRQKKQKKLAYSNSSNQCKNLTRISLLKIAWEYKSPKKRFIVSLSCPFNKHSKK